MALQRNGYPSRERSHRELLYVDFVESAPWNITRIDELRRYAPIGKMLLSDAIQMSNESG